MPVAVRQFSSIYIVCAQIDANSIDVNLFSPFGPASAEIRM